MRVRHASKTLERIERDPGFTGGFSSAIVRSFRMRLQLIRSAANELDFYALKSLHFEKLKGKRAHQRWMRLNQQIRLNLELERAEDGSTVVVIAIEDYH